MRKTRHLLSALSFSHRQVTYCAVDLEERSLTDSVREMTASFPRLDFVGLLGTYDDTLQYIRRGGLAGTGKKIVCWFGSSIGNFTREEASVFMKKWTDGALAVGDMFVVGVDKR